MSKVVHFEIPAGYPESALQFYKIIFYWKIEEWTGDVSYWLIIEGEDDETGISGGNT